MMKNNILHSYTQSLWHFEQLANNVKPCFINSQPKHIFDQTMQTWKKRKVTELKMKGSAVHRVDKWTNRQMISVDSNKHRNQHTTCRGLWEYLSSQKAIYVLVPCLFVKLAALLNPMLLSHWSISNSGVLRSPISIIYLCSVFHVH